MPSPHHKPDGHYSFRVSGPETPLLTTAEAKSHLRVDYSDDDTLIDAYISAATEMVDAQFGELGLALITQRWQLTMESFPASGTFYLTVPPVQQITSITYFDSSNVQQTLASNTYRLTVNGDHATVTLVDGQSWPATYAREDAVAVQYDAGFGDDASDVPEGIRVAVRLMVAHWYEHREAVSEVNMEQVPVGVPHLLAKYRIPRGHI